MKNESLVTNPLHCWIPIVPAINAYLKLNQSEAVVLGILYANSHNKFGQCFFYSHKHMSEMLSLSVAQTRRIINKLKEAGFFKFINKTTIELSSEIKTLYVIAETEDHETE